MVLVDYPESEDEQDTPPPAKRQRLKNLPPLPSAFKDLYAANARISTSDDPSLHRGRKRAVPHLEGNWSAHVYLEWYPSSQDATLLDSFIHSLGASRINVHSLSIDDLGVPRPLHISLSAPLVLRTETKAEFIKSMSAALTPVARTVKSPLVVLPISHAWHPNEEANRHFSVLRVSPCEQLWSLLGASNKIASRFGCPLLYQDSNEDIDRPFHVSIAWCLGTPSSAECSDSSSVPELPPQMGDLTLAFSEIKIRLGQDVTSIPFGSRV